MKEKNGEGGELMSIASGRKVGEVRHQNYEHHKKYRLSPLVSDAETWRRRIAEAEILTAKDAITIGDIYLHVRSLGFALMNANIRVNLDEKETCIDAFDPSLWRSGFNMQSTLFLGDPNVAT
eukprot:s33_g78.t1